MDLTSLAVAGAAALVAIGSAAERIVRGPGRDRERDTAPPSGAHAGSLLDGALAAHAARIDALERRTEQLERERVGDRAAADRREELAQTERRGLAAQLATIETILEERTSRRRERDRDRESS